MVALLSHDGETHVEMAGGLPEDTIFRIASMTKPVTAVAAMICVEECLLRLDDPVDEYLPELASRRVLTRLDAPLDDTVPAARAITLRDLLTFRLGLGFGAGMWGPPGSVPIMDALRALGQGMPAPAGVAAPAPAPQADLPLGRYVRLERRTRHHAGQRPGRELDADPADAAGVHVAPAACHLPRLLDRGIPGSRGLIPLARRGYPRQPEAAAHRRHR